ncbi:hypothetical protein AAW12_24475 [Sphingobacterium sp. Ag1]|nr:hypothetical protein AAW12_24475 [Sphingobacterium sp. Ag1]
MPQNATLKTEKIFGSTFITLKKFDYVRTKLWANLLSEEPKRKKPKYPPSLCSNYGGWNFKRMFHKTTVGCYKMEPKGSESLFQGMMFM